MRNTCAWHDRTVCCDRSLTALSSQHLRKENNGPRLSRSLSTCKRRALSLTSSPAAGTFSPVPDNLRICRVWLACWNPQGAGSERLWSFKSRHGCSLISALERGGEWRLAEQLFCQMCAAAAAGGEGRALLLLQHIRSAAHTPMSQGWTESMPSGARCVHCLKSYLLRCLRV